MKFFTKQWPAPLKFYLVNPKDAQPGTLGITLASGDQTVLASA